MLDRVSTVVVGLDGRGGSERFADYSQWAAWVAESRVPREKPAAEPAAAPASAPARPTARRLSYMEAREYESIEARIAEAESALEAKRAQLQEPAVLRDGRRLHELSQEIDAAQQTVDSLYQRWAELEARMA